MSKTIRELLDKFYDIANGGEGELSDIFVPDFELGIAPGFPYGGEYLGMDGVNEFFGNYKQHFDVWKVVCDQFFSVDEHTMIMTGSYIAKTANGGIDFHMETAHVWRSQGDKLKSLKQYCDTAVLSDAMGNQVPKRRVLK
mgnify:CR=1 FL=1